MEHPPFSKFLDQDQQVKPEVGRLMKRILEMISFCYYPFYSKLNMAMDVLDQRNV